MNFNKAIILGNLTRDPDSRTLPSGQPVVNFSIATNRTYTDQSGNKQQNVEFHNVVAFGKLADICSRYLTKGKMVLIEGRIQTRSWQDQSGNKRYRTEIVAENMQMGPRGGDSGTAAPPPQASSPDEIPIIETEELPSAEEDKEEGGVNVKDIPF
ncbi:MAG: single-stranded DNA-binding protein [Parcubacteria group bacterium CG1_02_40_82]|uniref:Single-stranded DNA-binding protein n=3 Tax=Candidatus Portnoyibacteriota TaxID=1817913 RepID=A0A2M7IIL6_9BACT|nr:MAG: single-stranded DNA-binding protein [Parcubacteria group bacterium CG1_02_40_82]PIQ75387.1 MAG: single-stranded DNA-binding protein [Candidatus Portnoybacteria bacterium CG11_big_fil_rev_8_21_14_0_20_40_15]PIW76308.1 MAG: single-stranded DNA-binding protein [Candidatus Portnoybacteria bacterium CG_4_8_14_3_um_filter_40_10]PJA64971.1 MAG: single-stranded DNA-binding protein [Candidatus Portnoybacteria bacterium CG_4_9_14_3_um_filter_40_10]